MIKIFKPLDLNCSAATAKVNCGCGCGDWGDSYRKGFRQGVLDYFNPQD
jgi:hypothetical protein